MIDRTNIGISQLNTNQKTSTSFAKPPILETTPIIPGQFTSIPVQAEAYTAPIVDQGYTLPQTTTTIIPETTTAFYPTTTQTFLPEVNFSTTISPQITLPEQTFTSFVPQINTLYMPNTELQTIPDVSGIQTLSSMPSSGIPGLSVLPEEGIPTMSVVPDASVKSIITPIPDLKSSVPLNVASSIDTPQYFLPPPSSEINASNPLVQNTITSNEVTVPPPVPQYGRPLGPINDEDFQRRRPIYDDNNQKKYRISIFGY